jgi:hypothetical protein
MREPGSGTRSEFEAALRKLGADPEALQVALVLPSNEAVLSAVRAGVSAAAAVSSQGAPSQPGGEGDRGDLLRPRPGELICFRIVSACYEYFRSANK